MTTHQACLIVLNESGDGDPNYKFWDHVVQCQFLHMAVGRDLLSGVVPLVPATAEMCVGNQTPEPVRYMPTGFGKGGRGWESE